ncbi:MAG: hypothetical protein RLZZ242_434 [Bacteroidota bacterium]
MKQAVRTNDQYKNQGTLLFLFGSLFGILSLSSCISYYPVSYRTHQYKEGEFRSLSEGARAQDIDREGALFYENYFGEKAAQLAQNNQGERFTDIDAYSSGPETTYAPFGQNAPRTRITINQFNTPFAGGWGSMMSPFFFNDPWVNPWINPWFDSFFGPVFGPSEFWYNGLYNRRWFNRGWGLGWYDPFWGRPLVYGFVPRRAFIAFSAQPRVIQGYRSGPTRSNPYYLGEIDRGRSNQSPVRSSAIYGSQNSLRNSYQQEIQRNSYPSRPAQNYRSVTPSSRTLRSQQAPQYNRSSNSTPIRMSTPSRSSSPSRSGSTRSSSSSRSNSRGNN